jgi:general secretion pathway protein C
MDYSTDIKRYLSAWRNIAANWRDIMVTVTSPALWPEWFRTFINRRLPSLLTVVLILAIAYTLANLTWQGFVPLFWKLEEPSIASPPRASQVNVTVNELPDYTDIAEMHLLGYIPLEEKTVRDAPVEAPETRLKLTLHGVFMFTGPRDGAAIIGRAGKKQNFYLTGQTISKGLELVEVRADHVLLLRDGRYEVLRFPKVEKPKLIKPDAKADTGGVIDIKEYRELFQKHPEKIAEHFNVVPVSKNGKLLGYHIMPQSNRSLYDELGLQPNDLIVAVNGIPLDDRSQLSQALSELTEADMLTINLKRNDKQETLILDLR